MHNGSYYSFQVYSPIEIQCYWYKDETGKTLKKSIRSDIFNVINFVKIFFYACNCYIKIEN